MNLAFLLCFSLSIGLFSAVNGQTDFCYNFDESPMQDAYYDIPEVVEMEYDDDLFPESEVGFHMLAADCSLDGLPTNNSQTKPYILPRVSDEVEDEVVLWNHPFVGRVNYTSIGPGSGNWADHYKYIKALWVGGRFTIWSNAITKDFTRTFQTRILHRYLYVYCCPNGVRERYHLNIPLQDMTPPEFQQDEYNFNITANWDHNRPISQGQFVIVGDNAYEIQNNDSFLRYSASVEDFLRVVPHRLWVKPNPRVFQYRLDLYLDESAVLTTGQHIQVLLSAKDDFNSGSTQINIYVDS